MRVPGRAAAGRLRARAARSSRRPPSPTLPPTPQGLGAWGRETKCHEGQSIPLPLFRVRKKQGEGVGGEGSGAGGSRRAAFERKAGAPEEPPSRRSSSAEGFVTRRRLSYWLEAHRFPVLAHGQSSDLKLEPGSPNPSTRFGSASSRNAKRAATGRPTPADHRTTVSPSILACAGA